MGLTRRKESGERNSKTREKFKGKVSKKGASNLEKIPHVGWNNISLKKKSHLFKEFDEVFKKVDIILTPTTPTSAFPLGSKGTQDPVEMYMNDIFTVPANLAGLPALSLPVGLDELGLPLGVQLIGNNWQEPLLLNTAFNLETTLAVENNPKKWWA